MTIKLIGALLVVLGCGGFGFCLAASQKREEKLLRQLISVLDYIGCELQYRLTPLPQLCRQAAVECSGTVNKLFTALATELDMQISPNAELCMKAALERVTDIPNDICDILRKLGHSLGRFDLPGQLTDLESIRNMCRSKLDKLCQNRDIRLRTYQTLGLCAGAALVILFI